MSPEIDAPAGSSATPVTAWRKAWKVDGPHFLGHNISHVQLDPRDGRTLLAAAKTGDIGFPMVVHPRDADTAWVFPMDGTTSGELWIRHEEGARWSNIARHLPEIYAVEVVQPA